MNKSKFQLEDRKTTNKSIAKLESKIVITTDGVVTTAKLYENGETVKVETAKCNPDDKYDFVIGARLAFDRLTETKEEEPKKAEENKPKFKVGDKIKVVANKTATEGKNKYVGNVYTIKAVHERGYSNGIAYSVGETYVVYESEIELAPKYYSGKVVCIETHCGHFTVGKIYEFVDGKVVDNDGDKGFAFCHVSDLSEVETFCKFVELKE